MKRHTFAIWGLFFAILFAFGTSIAVGSMLAAFISLIAGLVLAFVMSIAWVRFEGEMPEHHPPCDKFVDDMRP